MEIKKATLENIVDILALYDKARNFMYKNGNPNQWVNYPNEKIVRSDLAKKDYFCVVKKMK